MTLLSVIRNVSAALLEESSGGGGGLDGGGFFPLPVIREHIVL